MLVNEKPVKEILKEVLEPSTTGRKRLRWDESLSSSDLGVL